MPASRLVSVPLIGAFPLLMIHGPVSGGAFLVPVTASGLAHLVLGPPRRALSRRGGRDGRSRPADRT